MDEISNDEAKIELESSDVQKVATNLPIGVVAWGLTALVFFVMAWLGLKNPTFGPGSDPYLENCDWYRFIITRGYNCAYRQSGVIPVGPSHQLMPREAFNNLKLQNESNANQIGNPSIAQSRTLSVEVENQRFAIDTLHRSSDTLRLGAITTNGGVLVQQRSGWSVLSQNTRSITSVTSVNLFAHLNPPPDTAHFSPIAISEELQLVAMVDINNNILIENLSSHDSVVKQPPISVLSGHDVRVTNLSFLQSSDSLVSFDIDGNMLIWKLSEASDATLVASISTDEGQEPIHGFSVSATGDEFVIIRADRSISLWSTTPELQEVFQFESRNTKSVVNQVRLSLDGRLIAFSEGDNVTILDAQRGLKFPVDIGNGSLLDFDFLDGGQRFVAVTDIEVSVTELSTLGEDTAKLNGLSVRGPASKAWVGTNGNLLLLFSEENQDLIFVRGFSHGAEMKYSQEVTGLTSLHLSKDGNTILIDSTNEAQLIDLTNGGHKGSQPSLFEFSIWAPQSNQIDFERVITGLSDRGNYIFGRVSEKPTVAYIERSTGNDTTPRTLNMDAELIFSPAEMRYFKGSVPTVPATIEGATINDTVFSARLERHFAVGSQSKVWVASNASIEIVGTTGDLATEDIPELNKPESDQHRNSEQSNSFDSNPTVPDVSDLKWELVTIESINAEMELFSISVVDDLVIASGEKGYFVVSEDGGQSWQALQTTRLSPDILSVYLSPLADDVIQVIGSAIATPGDTISTLPQLHTARLKLDRPVAAQLRTQWAPVPVYAGFAMGAYVALALGIFCLLLSLYRWLHYRASRFADGDIPIGAGTSDRAIGWNDIDVLGIQGLAVQLSRFLRNVQTRPPLVIGVSGGWGSGKTSLMNLLYEDLDSRNNSAIWFNAWHHQHEHHLLASLFEAIRTRAIPPFLSLHGVWFRARLVLPRFLNVFKKWAPAVTVVLFILTLYFRGIDQIDYDELKRLKESLFTAFEEDFKNMSLPWKVASIPAALAVVYGLLSLIHI